MSNVAIRWPALGAEVTVPIVAEPRRRAHDEPQSDFDARVAAWVARGSSGRRPERVLAEPVEAFEARRAAWAQGLGRVQLVVRLVDYEIVVAWQLRLRGVHLREDARCAEAGLTRPTPVTFATPEGVLEYAAASAQVVTEGLVQLLGVQVGDVDLSTLTVPEVVSALRRLRLLDAACLAILAAQDLEEPEILA